MEQLLELLNDVLPAIDFEGRTDLVDAGDIDSLTMVMLVSELNDEYDINIKVTDLKPENFNSVEGIYAMVQRLQDED